jgi:hypothetical protein
LPRCSGLLAYPPAPDPAIRGQSRRQLRVEASDARTIPADHQPVAVVLDFVTKSKDMTAT